MELEHATLEDIADELRRRYLHVLVVVIAPPRQGHDTYQPLVCWRNGGITALGLCDVAKKIILEDHTHDH